MTEFLAKLTGAMVCSLSVLWLNAQYQDKVLTMSGREYDCNIASTEGFEVVFDVVRKSGRIKQLHLHKSEIFSITHSGKTEQLFYMPDPVLGDDLTVAEVRIYLAGRQDAELLFMTVPVFWIGLAGAGVAAWLANGGVFTSMVFPIVFISAQFIPVIKIKEKYITNPAHKFNDLYASGFEKVARSKRLMSALEGSGIGMVVGAVAFQVLGAQ